MIFYPAMCSKHVERDSNCSACRMWEEHWNKSFKAWQEDVGTPLHCAALIVKLQVNKWIKSLVMNHE